MNTESQCPWRRELRIFVFWYLGAWVAGFLVLLIAIWVIIKNPQDVWRLGKSAISMSITQWVTYVQPLLIYLLFVLIRSLVRNFKAQGWFGFIKGVGLKIVLPVVVIWGYLQLIDVYRYSESFDYTWDASIENPLPHIQNLYEVDGKYRGMHLFDLSADSSELGVLKTNNIEWLTFVPYISQSVYNKPPERLSIDSSWMQRRSETMEQNMHAIAPYDFKVMLKPHIWLQQRPRNTWRSDISMPTDADWEAWFAYYSEHMLMYASMAERLGFEMLCIGTELHSTVVQQPDRWRTLIAHIQRVYAGKLVYAANWSDNLEEIPFWDQMDYIGIQAYFPISTRNNPDIEELEAGWKAQVASLKKISEHYDKPVLFTEIGYKSTPDAATTPWEWEQASYRLYKPVSLRTQALSYQAFFNVIWPQPWFAGAFIWHWSVDSEDEGRNYRFTIRGKPALNVVARGFAGPE